MTAKRFISTLLWATVLALAWLSGRRGTEAPEDRSGPASRETMFHIHRPRHPGGKVGMDGQFHVELVSRADGTHRIWISNAWRQEMSPAGFEGRLRIDPEDGEPVEVPFRQAGPGRALRAETPPLRGQAWLTVTGRLGEVARFEKVKFFWDYRRDAGNLDPPKGLGRAVPVPEDNPVTAEKVALGRKLFFDPKLSADGTMSCGSCHRPDHGYAAAERISRRTNGRLGRRNAPSLLNVAYYPAYFWDGRADSLEAQARDAIRTELGVTSESRLIERLRPRYGPAAKEAFGKPLTLATVAKALATFERTLFSGDSDFDRYVRGEEGAISPAAKRGRRLFFGRARCGTCHEPPMFTDYALHNIGVGWEQGKPRDLGRFEVTGDPKDKGAFRTPSLRGVSRTGPYMHDGSLSTLREVVEFYNRGCRPNPRLASSIQPLGLSKREIDALVAFLKTLDGRVPAPGETAETFVASKPGKRR